MAKGSNELNGVTLIDSAHKDRETLEEFRVGMRGNDEYVVEKGLEDSVHFECEQVHFSGMGHKTQEPFCTVVPRQTWDFMRKQLIGQGYGYIKILHAPADCNVSLLMPRSQYEKMQREGNHIFPVVPQFQGEQTKKNKTRRQLKAEKIAAEATTPKRGRPSIK